MGVHNFLFVAQQQTDLAFDKSGPVTLGVAVAVGLLLWLLGRKLAKPAVSTCGLCMGAVLMFAATQEMADVSNRLALLWIVGGGIAGLLVAFLMYRFWMAASMALLFALFVPAASVVWVGEEAMEGEGENGAQVAEEDKDGDAAKDRLRDGKDADAMKDKQLGFQPNSLTTQEIEDAAGEAIETTKEVFESEQAEQFKQGAFDLLATLYDWQRAHIRDWWAHLEETGQRNIYVTAAIAALVGLLLGYLLPDLSTMIQTSLVGAFLILCGVRGLVKLFAEDYTTWLPEKPPAMLLALSLITILGIGLQWTITRKAADK